MSIIGRQRLVTIRNVQQLTAAAVSGQSRNVPAVSAHHQPKSSTLAECATSDPHSDAQFTTVGYGSSGAATQQKGN